MSDENEQRKEELIQEMNEYKNNSKKFPDFLRSYVKENISDQQLAERFLKEFDDSYLKIMNLDELELLCSFILKKRNIQVK
ncbi:conserved Plasmodium protein, unknown function [Plasmodium knowlesi strain H]|uniref:Uncharacterized protein n=3 Tax=Plasmodium knowlesi TaxID=5850 RepID=A0A5K1U9B8_PLAKH|nr:conserved Plasmodium protein, unknown function [Plasmodium knowlesi strain H]OTN67505.1 Uncharacterized protein PKNOH_S06406300 [Plasmodium knowlesi]CAA9987338.1 conserved Plasmodium protein, unknown function [Plasmodium knowlesi strain H]SBO23379.1 conserved Plasmodium protein, unknown function [Plasmodium knowlesi strain H]SBO24593.1 conserved Plasmodium protein, unknown function [Plasmodium knowlesi strain H]VVS76812.1 conserved Plasmodium protein, unknown function [Plasmodium knowlesi s|eukprot:XP_002258341.1 hypothetical protein, conserved in Plasmodium species [Plasmodium knowlesi strain H]